MVRNIKSDPCSMAPPTASQSQDIPLPKAEIADAMEYLLDSRNAKPEGFLDRQGIHVHANTQLMTRRTITREEMNTRLGRLKYL